MMTTCRPSLASLIQSRVLPPLLFALLLLPLAADAQDPPVAPEGQPAGPRPEVSQDLAPATSAPDQPDRADSQTADQPAVPDDQQLRQRLPEQLERLEQRWGTTRSLSFDPVFLSSEAAAASLGSRRTDRGFRFLRDNLAFDPYGGRVRGARGALFSHSGNSVDLALLATELLAAQGINWRLVKATLQDEQASTLFASALPHATTRGVDPATRTFDPALQRWRRRTVADHWWVEAEIDGRWVAFDPVYPGLELGQAVVEPERRFDTGQIPGELEHTVTIRLFQRRARRPAATPLTYTAQLVDLAYRNVVLSFRRESADTVRPTLEFSGEIRQGERIDLREAEQIWIELEFGTGRTAYTVRRDLRDPSDRLDLFAGDLQVFSVLFLPGWVGPDYYAAVSQALAGQLQEYGQLLTNQALVDADSGRTTAPSFALLDNLQPILSTATGLIGLTFAHRSDEMSLALAQKMGVRPFFARPRILIAGAVQLGSDLGFQLDLRNDAIESLPYSDLPIGLPPAFQALRGRIDSQLASEVLADLTGLAVLGPEQIIRGAMDLQVGFLSLSSSERTALRRLDVPQGVRDRMEQDATGAGGVVITPAESLLVSGSERTAWWVAVASDGSVLGVLGSGIRGAVAGFLSQAANLERPAFHPLALASGTLSTIEALLEAVIRQTSGSPTMGPDLCPLLCDLVQASNLACGDPSRANLSRCLSGGVASEDPLGLGLSCQEMVNTFRCGVVIAQQVLSGAIELEVDRPNAFQGPWSSRIPPLYTTACRCE
ncbi:MAG: hypothetical protein JW797_07100 [Bradymonadales bacterium]|nr:hypothetical protein [Bradymonadales bacterium]